MHTSVVLAPADIVVICVLLVLILAAIACIKGFFQSGKAIKKHTGMIETTVQLDGMSCAMCEAHVNHALRTLNIHSVSSNCKTNRAVILADHPISEAQLHQVLDALGYRVVSVSTSDK